MLLRPPTVPLSRVVGGSLVSDVVRRTLVAQNVSGVVPHLGGRRLFALQHQSGISRGVGLESEVDQVIHAPDVLLCFLVSDIQVQPLGVNFWEGFMRPLACTLDSLFDGPNGFEILIHFALIGDTEPLVVTLAVIHQQIQNARITLESSPNLLDTFARVRVEQSIENLLRFVHGGNGPPGATVRQGFT